MTGRVAPGWYPDYDAPPGHQRYWDGQRWTERRHVAPEEHPPVQARGRRYVPWVLAAAAVLAVLSAAVLLVGDDAAGPSRASPDPLSSSTPGAPATGTPTAQPEADRRVWQVEAVVDGSTLRLTNGAEVRLSGIADSCATDVLRKMVVGEEVTLTRRGRDKDAEGALLRYVERDGVDIGGRLIQRGWAKAADDANPRRAIYRRIDERSPDVCG